MKYVNVYISVLMQNGKKRNDKRRESERDGERMKTEWCSVLLLLLKRKYINISNVLCGEGTCEPSDVH